MKGDSFKVSQFAALHPSSTWVPPVQDVDAPGEELRGVGIHGDLRNCFWLWLTSRERFWPPAVGFKMAAMALTSCPHRYSFKGKIDPVRVHIIPSCVSYPLLRNKLLQNFEA